MKDYSLFLQRLEKLISFESVRGEPLPNKPFGSGVYDAYKYFMDSAAEFGFDTVNYDNYIGEAVFGEGEEIGIIGHLDVVPAGNGWNTDPFKLTKKGDAFYARGIMDDKAPLLMCLFILKELKDCGKVPKRKFRLIAGCNEESGWEDADYFKTKAAFPEYGFSPDGNFPVSYAEKGMAVVEFSLPALKNFSDIKGGTVINAVCGYATAKAENTPDVATLEKFGLKLKGNNVIESVGKSAHGSQPQLGKNALKPLFEYFYSIGEDVGRVIDYLFNDKAGLFEMKNAQGNVTLSPNIAEEKNGRIYIRCDCRYPAPIEFKDIISKLDTFGIDYTYEIKHGTQYVERDGEFVNTLISAYNSITGEKAFPISQSGSTFARVFKKGCAFGPEFSGSNNRIHEPNERVTEKDLLKMYEIYKKAIFELAGAEE